MLCQFRNNPSSRFAQPRCLTIGDIFKITNTTKIPVSTSTCPCAISSFGAKKRPWECATKEDLAYMLEGVSSGAGVNGVSVNGYRVYMWMERNSIQYNIYAIDDGTKIRLGTVASNSNNFFNEHNIRIVPLFMEQYVFESIHGWSSESDASAIVFKNENILSQIIAGINTSTEASFVYFYFEIAYIPINISEVAAIEPLNANTQLANSSANSQYVLDEGELNTITQLLDSIQERCKNEMPCNFIE